MQAGRTAAGFSAPAQVGLPRKCLPPVRQASEITTTVVNEDQAHLQLTVEFGASSAGIWNANAVGSWRVSSRSQEKKTLRPSNVWQGWILDMGS